MKKSGRIKRIVCGMVAIMLMLSLLVPNILAIADENQSDALGTQFALGSPLLDKTFDTSKWDPDELYVFGIYLSNFLVPFVDDYPSAFSTGRGGSEGAAFQALAFNNGGDTNMLRTMLDSVISASTAGSNRPIYIRESLKSGTSAGGSASGEQQSDTNPVPLSFTVSEVREIPGLSNIERLDLEMARRSEESLWGLTYSPSNRPEYINLARETADADRMPEQTTGDTGSTGNRDSTGTTADPDGDSLAQNQESLGRKSTQAVMSDFTDFSKGSYKEFFIDVNNEGKTAKVVYDTGDDYDLQMMAAWMANAMYSGELEATKRSWLKVDVAPMMSELKDKPLYLDTYGNITVEKEGRYVMVFPAACNQHITTAPQYNLVNSVFLGGNYMSISRSQYWELVSSGTDASGSYDDNYSPIGDSAVKKVSNTMGDSAIQDYQTLLVFDSASSKHVNPSGTAGERVMDVVSAGLDGSSSRIPARLISTLNGVDAKNVFGLHAAGWFTLLGGPYTDLLLEINESRGGLKPATPILHKINLPGSAVGTSLFDTPVVTSSSMPIEGWGSAKAGAYYAPKMMRNFLGAFGDWYAANDTKRPKLSISWTQIESELKSQQTPYDVATYMRESSGGNMSELFASFVVTSGWSRIRDPNEVVPSNTQSTQAQSSSIETLKQTKLSDIKSVGYEPLTGLGPESDYFAGRVIKAYPSSAIMRAVADYFALGDKDEFAKWCPAVYLAYLRWYGLIKDGVVTSNTLDRSLYPKEGVPFDPADVESNNLVSKEEKVDSVLDQAYLMLDPEKGRELRSKINRNDFADMLYDWYTKIVYGSAIEKLANSTRTVATRTSSGFLHVDNYMSNPFTSWFVSVYAEYAIVLLGIGLILIIVFGLVKRERFMWFIMSAVLLVNVIIITPILGDIIPYVANKTINSALSRRMDFWGISESTANALIEERVNSKVGDGAGEQVINIIKAFTPAYLDRSLVLRWDISKKVTSAEVEGYGDLQKFKTARWLLPTIMRQWDADNESADYVYITMGDALDNLRNMYRFYRPDTVIGSLATPDINEVEGTQPDPDYVWDGTIGGGPGGNTGGNPGALPGGVEDDGWFANPVPDGVPTSPYGESRGDEGYHIGSDYGGAMDTPIYSMYSGVVLKADRGKKRNPGAGGGYGNLIEIDHGYGIKVRYAHNNTVYVNVGDPVKKGQHIAGMGNTGDTRGVTGIHLHVEMFINGKRVNPEPYMRGEKQVPGYEKTSKAPGGPLFALGGFGKYPDIFTETVIAAPENSTDMGEPSAAGGDEIDPMYLWSLYDGYRSITEHEFSSPARFTNFRYHTYYYLCNNLYVPDLDLNSLPDTRRKTIHDLVWNGESVYGSLDDSYRGVAYTLENIAGKYDVFNLGSVQQEYGYLWTTESPMMYFYMVIRDSFSDGLPNGSPDVMVSEENKEKMTNALSTIATALQGEYTSGVGGTYRRSSFMHQRGTGYVIDFLDMEELFTNVIPYMYTSSLIAGGVDGRSGVFGNELIDHYRVYRNNHKSWLFRSNWVIKIMESRELTRKQDVSGMTVNNPTLIDSYTSRPMVFSEAEQLKLGLTDFDLTDVELKIKNVGKKTAEDWTLLLNYINMEGMNSEVIYAHMALIATRNFNQEFSPTTLATEARTMYPLNIELRNISFDSLMRIMMLNATRDVNYVYNETMYNVVNNADIISGFLLLLSSAGCVWVIPLLRNFIMLMLLMLGLWATLTNIAIKGGLRWKVTISYAINLAVFLGLNLLFYMAINGLLGVNSPTDVLHIGTNNAEVRSPVWIMIILLGMVVLYIIGCIKIIKFTWKNYRDMGYTAMKSMLNSAVEGINNGISKVGGFISGMFGGSGGDGSNGSGSGNGSGNGNKSGGGQSGGSDSGKETNKDVENIDESSYESVAFNDSYDESNEDFEQMSFVDNEISRGTQIVSNDLEESVYRRNIGNDNEYNRKTQNVEESNEIRRDKINVKEKKITDELRFNSGESNNGNSNNDRGNGSIYNGDDSDRSGRKDTGNRNSTLDL